MAASLERVTVFECRVNVIDNAISDQYIGKAVKEATQYKNNLIETEREKCMKAMSNNRPLLSNLFVPNIIDRLPVMNEVVKQIQPYVNHYIKDLTGSIHTKGKLTRSWLAFQPSNAYVKKHNHLYHVFDSANPSGVDITHVNAVMYFQAEDEHDGFSVYYPCQSISLTAPRASVEQDGNQQSPSVFGMLAGRIPCRVNRLILIPSWLEHSVDCNVRQYDKICLSANYIFA